ncbi:MAG: GtrA family protein [Acidobacteriota bacterium]|nr:GtrA family protein [Acidobacteriota bacterium]
MNILARWGKFSAVGALGMALQLGLLAVFDRWMPGHYVWASSAAIEIALIHNFVWHLRFTWRDRGDAGAAPRRFARFQLSNGAISLAGNAVAMPVLVEVARLPPVAANLAAIGLCSAANFWVGNRWVFAKSARID